MIPGTLIIIRYTYRPNITHTYIRTSTHYKGKEYRPPEHISVVAIKKEPSGHPRLRSPNFLTYIYIYIYIYIFIYIYIYIYYVADLAEKKISEFNTGCCFDNPWRNASALFRYQLIQIEWLPQHKPLSKQSSSLHY